MLRGKHATAAMSAALAIAMLAVSGAPAAKMLIPKWRSTTTTTTTTDTGTGSTTSTSTTTTGTTTSTPTSTTSGTTTTTTPTSGTSGSTAPAGAAQVSITIDVAHPGRAANPLVLGTNVEWTDYGDDVLSYGALNFNPALIDKAVALAPTVLRYPGGLLSDTYRWQAGQGEAPYRDYSEVYYTRALQQVMMGTRELLELAEASGAQPLFTVNTATATAADAAQWVSYANGGALVSTKTGAVLPRVKYWEVGNEPYLKDSRRSDLWIQPDVFAQRAADFIRAMKAADPAIVVGLPMRSDVLGGLPATPWPGYNAAMIAAGTSFDFVSLHNSYLPYIYDGTYTNDQLYWAAMAAYRVVENDFAATRAQLSTLWPGNNLKLAVTEFSSLFTLNGSATDAYINTLAGALYVADILRVYAQADDLLFANFWSLSGNWHFGALSSSGVRRPAYYVLQAYRTLLRGRMLPLTVSAPTFDTARVGFVPAMQGLPTVTGVATLEGGTLRAVLINKHSTTAAVVQVGLGTARLASGTTRTITGPDCFDTRDTEDRIQILTGALPVTSSTYAIELPPHSVTVVEAALAATP